MPRKMPHPCPSKPNRTPQADRSYEIELITPMFGGGVEPRLNDSTFPIRPTAIRGQLQFWWRATVGAQYATPSDLRAAQSAVWGSTERASVVQVLVELLGEPSAAVPCAKIRPNHKGKDQVFWEPPFRVHKDPRDDALPYALFPFGKTADKKAPQVDPALCIHSSRFRLHLRCPDDLWPQVEPAVWAWANFGGLGSRTRRGCGAIRCKELAPRDHAQLAEQLKRFVLPQSEAREWATVAERILVREKPGNAIEVWDWLIGRFKHFRQGENFARNPGRGRSRYPEPETIRTVMYDPRHPWRHERLDHIPNDAFPRAELGLPIVFQFQGQGEPDQTVLYPSNGSDGKRRERMGSPLILKPLALVDGMALPLILQLRTPSLAGVDLRRGDTSLPLPPGTMIRGAQLSSYPNSPLAGSPNGSALEAFFAFACSEGFNEVSR